MKRIQITSTAANEHGDGQKGISFTEENGEVVAQLVGAAAGVGERVKSDDLMEVSTATAAETAGKGEKPDQGTDAAGPGEKTGQGADARGENNDGQEIVTATLAFDPERKGVRSQAEGPSPERPAPVQLRLEVSACAATSTWVARLAGEADLGVVIRRGGFAGQRTALVRLRLPAACRIHASYMFSDWWTRPAFPARMADVPARTQFLLWERADGRFGCLVPLVNGDLRANLQGAAVTASFSSPANPGSPSLLAATGNAALQPAASPDSGGNTADDSFDPADLDVLVATEKSGLRTFGGALFVLGVGSNPYELVHTVFSKAIQTLSNTDSRAAVNYPVRGRNEKSYPDFFEYLGWCSWNAFYQQVHAAGLLQKAQEFKDQHLPVKWVLIDDGWSPVRDGLLTGFGADPQKFPGGLAPVIRQLKGELGVRWVGVWHAFTGYWGGIDPAAEEMKEVAKNLVTCAAGRTMPGFSPDAAFGFYHAWHRRLQGEGVDLLKVDNQGAVYYYARETEVIPKAASAWEYGLQASANLHFAGRLLNCMAMSMDVAWFWNSSNVARSSDDFYPSREGSAREHALQNVYNGLWFGEIAWPDWDMWWTVHPQAQYHQALRAVSGGPIYTSDPLEKTDAALLRPLVFADGRILRCDLPARPTRDTLFHLPKVFKVFNRVGASGIVGLFWAGDGEENQQTTVAVADVEGLGGASAGTRAASGAGAAPAYVLHEYYTGEHRLLNGDEELPVQLKPWEARVYSLVPLTVAASLRFAAVGLVNKIIAPRSVIQCELRASPALPEHQQGHAEHAQSLTPDTHTEPMQGQIERVQGRIVLYEGGRFLAYCSQRPAALSMSTKLREVRSEIAPDGVDAGLTSSTATLASHVAGVSWRWQDGWLEVEIPESAVQPVIEITW
ncbi:MAG: hypothetical protein IMX01_09060 [Limnochordaceae bacterium]|nr:hypothetical protein [Limnochordaceae bacterium]